MAASAYAALRSLITVLDRVQNPTSPVSLDSSQMQSLMEKVRFLVDFMENCSINQRSKKLEDLERRITIVVYAAEDTVESYLVNGVLGRLQLPGAVTRNKSKIFSDLQKTIKKMNHFIKDVTEVLEEKKSSHGAKIRQKKLDNLLQTMKMPWRFLNHIFNEEYVAARQESLSLTPSPTPIHRGLFSPSTATRAMVGADEQLFHLMDLIKMHKRSREIIPIVGMGGIGKSTLALNVYTRPDIINRFDRRAWVTVSQQYTVKTLICPLLRDIGVSGIDNLHEEQLGDRLYKGLFGIRYLIIVDDIWSREAWYEIRRFLPENNNGSRVLFTTRLSSVAHNVGSCNVYEMKFLDVGTSWNLLSATIFGKETVNDSELEKVGKEIATCCKGLPLAIVVIGGLLKRLPKTLETWESIGKDVRSVWSKEQDGYCLDIISLSYNYLPVHLKPCFLYLATFKEDSEINITDLIKLWVADGFLRPINNVILEEAALEYVDELIDRNILMVKRRSEIGKVSNCIVHDLIREFCIGEVRKEKFICHSLVSESERRLVHHYYHPVSTLSSPLVRSIIAEKIEEFMTNIDCKLLRVLLFGGLLGGDLQFVNLRYVRCKVEIMGSNCLSWISLLPYLETLIVDDWRGDPYSREDQILPSKIWELQYLRHLEIPYHPYVTLPDPGSCYQSSCILENLQTLSGIKNFNCTDEVLYRVPNLKALRVEYDKEYLLDHVKLSRCFNNLARLDRLETLHVIFPWKSAADRTCIFREPENLMFARNLRELKISNTRIPWDNMRIVSSLPRLEMLKLSYHAFCGEEWEISEGEFECLKHLEIKYCDLSIWTVDSSALPRLKSLILYWVELEEVPPLAIGELASIESIEWQTRRLSTVIQLKKILEHAQEEQGNDLVMEVTYESYFEKGLFEEVMKKKLATDHFQLTFYQTGYPHETEVEELLGTDQCKDFMDRWNKEERVSRTASKEWKLYADEFQNKAADAMKQRLAMEFE